MHWSYSYKRNMIEMHETSEQLEICKGKPEGYELWKPRLTKVTERRVLVTGL